MAVFATMLLAIGIKFVDRLYVSIPIFLFAVVIYFFTFWFFRDPDRYVPENIKNDNSAIISPADGVITEIVEEYEPNYLKSESKRISIFLSPLDVHVNRIPTSGVVEYYNYNKGKFYIASKPKASLWNEQSHIGIKTKNNKIFFKQIVGTVARRLVCDLKVGDSVDIGERFGMMKFGSRMDIAVPMDTGILVKVGDRVIAGETLLGMLSVNK